MPTSHSHQINEIVELITLTNPEKLLDVGVGFGKYGFLAREYLELWEKEDYGRWDHTIDGIEGFPKYITSLQKSVYDRIFIGDALKILKKMPDDSYDLLLLVDIIEHFSYRDGRRLLSEARRVGRNVVVSTPKEFIPQGDAHGNPLETHRFLWQRRHLADFGPLTIIPNDESLIAYLGSEAGRIERDSRIRNRVRAKIKRRVPVVVPVVRAAKRVRTALGSRRNRRSG